MEDKIRADSCIFVDISMPFGYKNACYFVHFFLVFVSVCDIFDVKSVCKELEKELFWVLILLKRGKMSVK